MLFQLDQDQRGEAEGWQRPGHDRRAWREVQVPGAWDFYDPSLRDYEGTAWYAWRIPRRLLKPRLHQRLHFASVHHHAKAWIDGKLKAEHWGGYFPFEVALPPEASELVLRVDNQAGYDRLPGSATVEWVQYGGITQPVTLLSTPKVWISRLVLRAQPRGAGAEVNAEIEVSNASGKSFDGELDLRLEGAAARLHLRCPPGAHGYSAHLFMPKAAPWSPDSPRLHGAEARLSNGHRLRERFGVRRLEAAGRRLLLNGKPLQIRGFNRYDEFPGVGATAPESWIRKDLLKVKKSGANLIRVHYPQSPLHLRLMDEIGLLLMEEVPLNWWRASWHKPVPREYRNDRIIGVAEKGLEAMIRRDAGHPCLAFWSMANESQTGDKLGTAAMRRLMARARALDPGRLVTFVPVGEPKDHPALAEADIACGNMYHGLFHGPMAAKMREMGKKVYAPTLAYLRRAQAQSGAKPFLMTECGAQAIPGMRGDVRMSEDFQAEYLRQVWRAVKKSGVLGLVIWSWADYRHRRGFMGTGKGPMLAAPYGPFGVVGLDRKPKQAFHLIRKLFHGKN